MKFDLTNWEKNKKRVLFFLWPMAIAAVLDILVTPFIIGASPKLALLTPLMALIVFAPFIVTDARRQKAKLALEKRELQTKYDAEDTAMFGTPLREIEL